MPADSMAPTVPLGATVQVDYDAFDQTQPSFDDIVVFRPPSSFETSGRCGVPKGRRQMCPRPVRRLAPTTLLKRVVGLPGDRLRLRGGRLTRNGELLKEPYADVSSCDSYCDFPREITVAAGHFFMLGDNRGASDDSRFWGPVPSRALVARVVGCTTNAGLPCGDAS